MVVGIDFGTANTSVAFFDGKKTEALLDQYGSSRHPVTPPGSRELVFRQSKKLVEKQSGSFADTAVVAVPVNLGEDLYRGIVESGKRAGFRRISIVTQAEAAVVSMAHSVTGNVLVLDFGESRFEAALTEVKNGDVELKRAISDGSLGGAGFTRDIRLLLQRKAGSLSGSLKGFSESLKTALSSAEEITHSIQGIPVTLCRREYEKILGAKVSRIGELVRRLLRLSGLQSSGVDTVLLRGGGSHIPCIKRCIRNIVPETVSIRTCPAEAAATGATDLFARRSASLQSSLSVSPSDFGLEIDWGKSFWMLKKNSPLPVSMGRTFTTLADNQRRVEIHVIQKGAEKSQRLISLSRFILREIPPAPHGRPKIEIQFMLYPNGLLTVSVASPAGRISETMKVTTSGSHREGSGCCMNNMDNLISRVEREYRGRRFFIDPDFSEDINGILKLARRGKQSGDPGIKRECSIALWSVLKEIKSMDAGREADCAG